MAQVSGIEIAFKADTSNFDKGVAGASTKLQNFSKLAAAGLAGLATAAAASGVAIGELTRRAINFADEIGKTAQKIGMTSESLSQLEYAAKLSDVSLGQLQVGLGQLAKNMQDGDKAFAALGISVLNSEGYLRTTEEVLLDIAERFVGMQDGAGKTAIAMQLFGRSGADLIPFLNAGRDGISQMTDQAQRLGLTISTQTSQAAEGFNDNLTRLGAALTGLGNKIAERSAPALKNLTDRIVAFVEEGNLAERIANAIGAVMQKLAEIVQWTASAWEVLSVRVNGAIASLGYLSQLDLGGAMDAWAASSVAAGKVWERNTEILAEMRGEIQSVNSEMKGDLPSLKTPAPIIPDGTAESTPDKRQLSPYGGEDPFFIDRLDMIREQFATERELLLEEYTLNQEVLDGALANKLLSEQEYYELSKKLADEHQTSLARIQQTRLDNDLTAASDFFGALAQITALGGKKTTKIAKMFGIAQALISTFQGAAKALTLPFPANLAAYATTLAQGMSAVAAIRGVSESGSNSGSSSGSSSGSTSSSASTSSSGGGGGAAPTTTFSFTLMNDPMGFGEKFARQFIDQLNSTQRNGGTIRGVIA